MMGVQRRNNQITFFGAGIFISQIRQWERALDIIVLKEQLLTGSFRGRWHIGRTTRKIMLEAAKEGRIMPYYGAGGNGACFYHFLPGEDCPMQVYHSTMQRTLKISGKLRIIKSDVDLIKIVTEPNKTHQTFMFTVGGTEYQNLVAWENWQESEAMQSRYIYKFAPVTIGPGYAIKVEDRKTGQIIDVTDYDSW